MEDFDYVNEEFFNMWKERTGKSKKKDSGSSKGEENEENDMNFNGKDIELTLNLKIENTLFTQ